VTLACCAVIVGLFGAIWGTSGDAVGFGMLSSARLSEAGGLDMVRVWLHGEWWRLVTGAWLHGSWAHVLLNAVGLWSVGRWVEGSAGGWRMLGVLLLGALVGCLTSLATVEAAMVVGISGGVFGLAGALLVLRTLGNDVQRAYLQRVSPWELGFWLVLWLVIGGVAPGILGDGARIAQSGHIGGLVGGSLACLAFGVRGGAGLPGWVRPLSIGVLGLGVVGLAWFGRQAPGGPEVQVLLGYQMLEDGAYVEAAEAFSRARAYAPEDVELLNAEAYALAEAGLRLDEARVLVERALHGEVDPEFELNALDTQAWIDCRAGRSEVGLARLERVVGLAEARGVDPAVFREHAGDCAAASVAN